MNVRSERFIYRDEQYHDASGRMILERYPIAGTPPEGFCRFRSLGTIDAQLPNGQHLKRDFIVPLPKAETVEQAFELVDDEVKRLKGPEIEKFTRELGLGVQGIVAPSANQTRRILGGPNGGLRRML